MRPKNFVDLTGKKFGLLSVLSPTNKSKRGQVLWNVLCDCGTIKELPSYSIRVTTRSCGCLRHKSHPAFNKTHGKSYTKEYKAWISMKGRCYAKSHVDYPYWGGRGIEVDSAWVNSFEKFFEDMGECPKGCSLDRKNNAENYGPLNCRWATYKEQAANRRPPNTTGYAKREAIAAKRRSHAI